MSGVLHPTGPEPARTYWVRRGILLAVVLLLVAGVVLAVANLTKAAVATAPPPPLPAGNPASSPSPGASRTSTPSTSTPSVSTALPSTSVPPSATPSTSTSAAPSGPASAPPSASAKPSPGVTVIGTPDCRPADLRLALKGDGRLSVGENTTFTVSMANAGRLACLTSVTAANFELTITSGPDRIWSSRDCAAALAPFDKKLAAKGAFAWSVTWNGERSVQGKKCQRGTGKLKAGTYRATAQLKGVDPARVRMTIG